MTHPVVGGVVLLLGAYVILLALGPRWLPVMRWPDLIITLDILVSASVVAISGSLESPFLFVFYLTILEAAARLNLRQAIATSAMTAGLVLLLWLRGGHAAPLETAGFRLGLFIAGGFFIALFLGTLLQDAHTAREREQWVRLLDERLRDATAQLKEQLQEVQFYNALSSQLAGKLQVTEVLEVLLQAFLETARLSRGAAYVYGEDGTPHPAVARGVIPAGGSPQDGADLPAIPLPSPAPGQAGIIISGARADGGASGPGPVLVSVAVRHAGGLRAWLCGVADTPPPTTAAVHRRLLGLAAQGGPALEAACLHEQLTRLAATDWLTGLNNRRSFLDRLSAHIVQSRRRGAVLSLALLDLDGFKLVNDIYGHAIGDQLLRRVAKILADYIRASDLAARFGGDEFVLLFPDTTRMQAEAILTRLLALELPRLHESASDSQISFSWGIATWPEDADDAEALLRVADAGLYARKQSRQGLSTTQLPQGSQS